MGGYAVTTNSLFTARIAAVAINQVSLFFTVHTSIIINFAFG